MVSDNSSPIDSALKAFRSHNPVAVPTETVYGLAAPVSDLVGIKRIFELKGRPLFNPLIVHVDSLDMAKRYAKNWSHLHDSFASSFWPGPLGLIVGKNELISDLITASHPTVALRMPDHPIALGLIKALGQGLAAPSANKSNSTSPSQAEHVLRHFGTEVLVLDGGECRVGLESTLLEIKEEEKEIVISRPGLYGCSAIEAFLKDQGLRDYRVRYGKGISSPGQLRSHYRPQKPLVVYEKGVPKESVSKAIEKRWGKVRALESSLPEDPYLAARSLYGILQPKELESFDLISLYAPMDLSMDPWVAVKDRLEKAASLFL
ncbi:MAG: L-threonylcarbamoyladenylate synthase [Bacteriovoracales bacterium]|nr:L-threonylcarbamoyladenylate synthase [Bacteriovoracales bacterium]